MGTILWKIMSRPQFRLILNSEPFVALRREIQIPKHNDITYYNIFKYMEPELQRVEDDIRQIFTIITNDVTSELKQAELLDRKLKSTCKHLRLSYSKVSRLRRKNAKYALLSDEPVSSKHLFYVGQTTRKCEDELNDLGQLSDTIIKNIVAINNLFNEDNNVPILSLDNLSEHQFPILFRLLKERYPEVRTRKIKKLTKPDLSSDRSTGKDAYGGSIDDDQGSFMAIFEPGAVSSFDQKVKDNIGASNIPTSVNHTNLLHRPVPSQLVPSFLHKKASPSTFTTLEAEPTICDSDKF